MRLIVWLVLVLNCIPVIAADTARSRMETFSKDLKSVSGSFTQQVFDNANHARDRTSGTLSLQAPRQFRWDTNAPYKQLIVADGERVWIYDPDLEQVTVRNLGTEEAHSPLTILTDLDQLDRQYTTSEQGEHDGYLWLRLKSKDKEPEFEYADLGLDERGLKRMVFLDKLGNRTEIVFSDWQRNKKLSADSFKFVPPKGTDVIGNAEPTSEVFPVKN
ncbi:outer membrane lipoprotein chaperone LolA [Pseudolysobacter antarcticus]|uniref:Outer-membrane lipoprotein carrier protein n=1 Tax=Pseudolysobacter antarcticus TaxID=2511995 RepID=A0A411HJ30_9GAMM|nr:outer membrane lipoprotein chaperone LolA [Pseudolysobacter antarcticus]QBB70532.1 outer membrane lipoprotein chaperone LolA [Pseudolysobacter antarcticus]